MYTKPFVSTCSYRIPPTYVVQLFTKIKNCETLTVTALTKLCLQRSNLCFNVALYFHTRNYACSGWTMVFKIMSGVRTSPWSVLSSLTTVNELEKEALDITNTDFRQHYKSRIMLLWESFKPAQASVSLK